MLTETRELMLDYPNNQDAGLRLAIANTIAAQPSPDWAFVADTVENVALQVVNSEKGDPIVADFNAAKFNYNVNGAKYPAWNMQNGSGWPSAFAVTDVDCDGSKDVVLAAPAGRPGVALLMRHTKQGWVSNRLAVGLPVKSIWTFPISPGGPVAIVLASLADGEYDPNLLIDVFAWQNGGVSNILSAQISHGWQWDHYPDVTGNQMIRLVARSSAPDWSGSDPDYSIMYRWNGAGFAKASETKHTPEEEAKALLNAGMAEFDAGRFDEALRKFNASLQVSSSQYNNLAGEHSYAQYSIGLIRAIQGDYAGAVNEMNASIKDEGSHGGGARGRDLVVDGSASLAAMARTVFSIMLGTPINFPLLWHPSGRGCASWSAWRFRRSQMQLQRAFSSPRISAFMSFRKQT